MTCPADTVEYPRDSTVGRLKASGLTPVLAEQNVRFVSELGDRVYILERGMVRYQGSMAEFVADAEVRQAYLAV